MSFPFEGYYITLYLPEDISDEGQHTVEYTCRIENKTFKGFVHSDRTLDDFEHWGLLVLVDAEIELP